MSFDKIDKDDIKIRKRWPKGFNPATKIEKVKPKYDKPNLKKEIEAALDELEEDKYDQYDE